MGFRPVVEHMHVLLHVLNDLPFARMTDTPRNTLHHTMLSPAAVYLAQCGQQGLSVAVQISGRIFAYL